MTVGRRRMHPQGPEFSRLAWGGSRALRDGRLGTPAAMAGLIEACLEIGITTFDHADIYGGGRVEAAFGAGLKAWGGDRSRLEIVTKCGVVPADPGGVKGYDASPDHVLTSVEASLRALQTDRIDLLLLHRFDPLTDADATASALERLIESGKVRHLGVSNHTPAQFDLLRSRLATPLVTNQVRFSVLHTEPLFDGTLDHAQRLRASPMAWAPLGGGALFVPDAPTATRTTLAALDEAGELLGGVGRAAAALAWLLRHPSGPVPVLGTTRPDRLAALARADGPAMDRRTWFRVLEAARGRPVP